MSKEEVHQYIPKPYKLWKIYSKQYGEIYYINDKKVSISYLNKHSEKLPACLSCHITDENEVFVSSLHSKVRGCGTLLIYAVINDMFYTPVDTICLDDMSSRYGQTDNIYIKLGMKYNEVGYPEMEGNIKSIFRRWRRYKNNLKKNEK